MYIQNIDIYAYLCIHLSLALHDKQSANTAQVHSRNVKTLFLCFEIRLHREHVTHARTSVRASMQNMCASHVLRNNPSKTCAETRVKTYECGCVKNAVKKTSARVNAA